MRRQLRTLVFSAGIALVMAGAPGLRAQQPPGPPPEPQQAPERGVARISIMNGQVSVRRGDSGDWVAGIVNAPLMVEDRISTGPSSRAEVQFDSSNMIRIGANAEIRLAQLDPGRYNIQVAHGTVSYRVLRPSRAQVEVDTPPVSVRPANVGTYRIYVQEDGETEITVRAGEVEIFTPRGTEHLQAGQTMLARNPQDPEFQIVPAIAMDSWDRWNEQRDREMLRSTSYRNVPQDVYGAEDLDSSGRWVDVPEYGNVWSPSVDPDWAPYQNGRWSWEDWYGWTWVSYDPWGWAPFHYGRWFYSAPFGWCWYPGGVGVHYWSPGLVAFFGYGGGVGFGFGFGNVGWVPLAPFEAVHPWWGRGYYGGFRNPGYFNRNVNVTNVNITNLYRNARVNNAVSGMNAADFQQGRFNNVSRVSGAQIQQAGLVRGQLPMAPTSASLRYSNRPVTSVPRSADNMRFFSHNQPAPVQRVSFTQQQSAMQQFNRTAAISRPGLAPQAPAGGGWRPMNQSAPSSNGGWQRFGEPRPAAQVNAAGPNGWRPSASSYRPSTAPAAPGSGGRPESIRIAPSVVRERSAPAPRGGGGGGGGAPHGGGGGGGGSHGGGHGK